MFDVLKRLCKTIMLRKAIFCHQLQEHCSRNLIFIFQE